MQVVDGITDIQAERDSVNLASENLPPTLPHELIKLPTCEFTSIIFNHVDHLKQFWSEEMIDKLERQHYHLLLEYQLDIALKSALDECDSITSFEIGWSIVEGKSLMFLETFVEELQWYFQILRLLSLTFQFLVGRRMNIENH